MLSTLIAGTNLWRVQWRHEGYLTYGGPGGDAWILPLAIPPR
jgi:hypothetical protein